jgi:trehalose 6-phosphate synthase/phosphatase
MLFPQMLRDRIPEARIGYFLHVPFPSSEIFRLLPQREQLLRGVLGADLVGFHTASYLRHFASSVLRLTSTPAQVDRIRWRHGEVRLGVFPMGIDAADFSDRAASPEVAALVREHRHEGMKLLVGVDRLDYTKGIPRRLLAFEALLQRHPELRGRVRLVQVAVPSRERVEAYQEFRGQVDALVGRIHGAFATATWSPINYLYRGLSRTEIIALYRAADAVLVTPLRDGMNLVAKEFVASRPDGDGVLLLSEFAGAASELAEALRLNPYDVEGTAELMHDALRMPEEERRTRMAGLRNRVMKRDVHVWARAFVDQLEAAGTAPSPALRPSSASSLSAALERARAARNLVLLLDYDGTLVPFVPTPELAMPDGALVALLRRLTADRRLDVHVVSGRRRDTLARWLGALPLGLHAEHGLWSRAAGGEWVKASVPDFRWRDSALRILDDFADRTPGAFVEEKTAGLAWHFRAADPEYGEAQARELSVHLSALLSNEPVELLQGDKVIELRPHGIDKGRIARSVLERAPAEPLVLAAGDDRTDEDLFAALPEGALAIHVGPSESRAALRVPDIGALRSLLGRLVE